MPYSRPGRAEDVGSKADLLRLPQGGDGHYIHVDPVLRLTRGNILIAGSGQRDLLGTYFT